MRIPPDRVGRPNGPITPLPLTMRPLFLLGLAAVLAAAPSAQNRTQSNEQTPQDQTSAADGQMSDMDYRDQYRSRLDRLDRDLRTLRSSSDPAMRSDIDRLRTDYDALRTEADGDAMSDPEAAARLRTDLDQRYADLDRRVYETRLRSARSRDAYVGAATDRIDMYDRQIGDFRMRYESATGTMRSDMARDLIRLRGQRDAYRDAAYSTRGMLRTDFEGGRAAATSQLQRYDTEFTTAYREASMRGMDGQNQPQRSGSNM